MKSVSFIAPWPPHALHPNARTTWTQRYRVSAEYAQAVRAAVCVAGLDGVRFVRAELAIEAVVPLDGRRRDLDGVVAAFKYGIDGFVQMGLLPDDDLHHLTRITVSAWERRECRIPELEITLTGVLDDGPAGRTSGGTGPLPRGGGSRGARVRLAPAGRRVGR